MLTALDLGGETIARWDRLAIEARRPHSAPAWLTAWWERARPAGAEMALITASEGPNLIGVIPLFARRRHYAPFGDGLMPVEPLAVPGREPEAAAAFAEALARLRPRTLAVEVQDDSPDWVSLICDAWPGGRAPWRTTARVSPEPRVELDGMDFEQWFEAKSANFRKDLRRKAKRLEKEGGELREADAASLDRDVDAFLDLHLKRHPKGSPLAGPGVAAMLREVGESLLPSGRFRLALLEVGGEPEAGLVLSAAGGRVSAWSSGMGERLARHSPVMHIFVEEIERMAALGEDTMDLGPGGYGYKQRLASVEGSLTTTILIPRGRGHVRSRGRYLLLRGARQAEAKGRALGGRARRAVASS